MIRLENVSLSANGQKILDNVSLHVNRGETIVIVGPSGAGKTSILRAILGLWKPNSGSVFVGGQDVTPLSEKQLLPLRRKMAIVFQGNALFDSMTVEQNVAFFLREQNSLTEAEMKQRVTESLSFVNLQGTEKLFPEELSGGMKKRVALARALAPHPDVILYDEPTTGLDPLNAKTIVELILRLKERGNTSVVVTHILRDALLVADRLAVMDQGTIVESGETDKMLTTQNEFVRTFFSEVYEEASILAEASSSLRKDF